MKTGVQACGSSFDELGDNVWAMMNEVARHGCFRSHAPRSWRPRVNLYEMRDRYVVCVELAGMSAAQIELQTDGDNLKIRGNRSRPTIPGQPGEVSVHLMEIDSGPFSRKVPLPSDVVVEQIRAAYRQGYLWILLPRSTRERGTAKA